MAQKSGFRVIDSLVLPDDEGLLTQAVVQVMNSSDIAVISGGSSAGKKDLTAKIIAKLASEGVDTHGLAIRPGKPTILGCDRPSKTVLVGLPGHPVSAIVVFELLVGWLYKQLANLAPKPAIPGRLSRNVSASPGKLTCCPCKLAWTGEFYAVEPILYKSGLITCLTQSDGYFLIEKDTEGLQVGQTVMVNLF